MRNVFFAVVAMILAPVALQAQTEDEVPSCKAHLDGQQLTTSIEFATGYRVEGPWHVLKNQAVPMSNGRAGVMLGARLDEIVEIDTETGSRSATTLPTPIAVTFQAATQEELVTKAATVFCFSVVKARGETTRPAARTASARAAD